MPTYTYVCTTCAGRTEAVRRIADRDDCPACPHCATNKTVSDTERRITPTMVSVFSPYRAVAIDKESGKYPVIKSRGEHEAFLARNGYEEVGNDQSMAPLPQEEVKHRRKEKLKELAADPHFEFNTDTHEATLGDPA